MSRVTVASFSVSSQPVTNISLVFSDLLTSFLSITCSAWTRPRRREKLLSLMISPVLVLKLILLFL